MLHTSCSRCYFSNIVDSEQPCAFHIPEAIKDIKKIDIIENFYYIHEYTCKYGVSKEAVNNKIKEHNIDILEYAKHQAALKYTLYVKVNDINFITICDKINHISIQPQFVHLVFDADYDFQNIAQTAEQQFANSSFKWKLHKFIEKQPEHKQLHISLSTNQLLSKYIWILKDSMLDNCINHDSINQINYTMNIEQPKLAIMQNKSADNYFFGLFMTLDNLEGIWSNVSDDLDSAIKSLYNSDDILNYD